MVDGQDSIETNEPNPDERRSEDESTTPQVQQNGDGDQSQPQDNVTPTTTISTIAVQSGDTRLVIALLQSGEWLGLKVLEVQPELTSLGGSLEEATELSNAHNDVLLRLQSKQSPVEELLRQADQLISTQKPRAEVYAAMAETLGKAWRDVNELLELRKRILDCNVLFQCRADECRESMKALEMACNDTLLPIEIEAVKNFLSKIHDLRKTMLEALMGALQEGKTLLELLREIANEGTLDSRPDRIKQEADNAVLKVERWLEDLHDRRRLIEISFQNRKTQLEQCLALALLATDLRNLEETLNARIAALSASSDQLGDSPSSAELLLYELKKLQTEAKDFQDRSIKITKSTEILVSSGHFAGEQATDQAYAILSAAADYMHDLEQYESLLNRAIIFFDLARSAVTKLDQLEIQLLTTEHPPYSPQLARFHAQTAAAIEEVTSKPIMEGYALLDVTGRGAPGAEGVKRMVEELENRKIQLSQRCTAHEEKNLEISRAIDEFTTKHNELNDWLIGTVDAFLRGHQDMGSDLLMAKDFHNLHFQLLDDLEKRGNDLEQLEFDILPIGTYLDESQKSDFETKIMDLKNNWSNTKNLIHDRVKLGASYVQFHEVAEELSIEVDSIEDELKRTSGILDEAKVDELGHRWKDLQPLYLKLTGSGRRFLEEAEKVNDPYLDVPRACLCVQSLMEKFANRQLSVTESWEKWRTTIDVLRERRVEYERRIEESIRTLEWVSKFGEQLYPVITTQSYQTSDILQNLKSSKHHILPEVKKAVEELESRIKSIDPLVSTGDMQINEEISNKLSETYHNLRTTAENYGDLLESLISVFNGLSEVEDKLKEVKVTTDRLMSLNSISDVDFVMNELETTKQSVSEMLTKIQSEAERTVYQIDKQEPKEVAYQDIEKLKSVLESMVVTCESSWSETITRIEEHRRITVLSEDAEKIDSDIRDLREELHNTEKKSKENLPAAKTASTTIETFIETITTIEKRIEIFEKTLEENIIKSAPRIGNELNSLKEKKNALKKDIDESRKRMESSVEYFTLLDEAEEWYRDGSKLLITVARRATSVKAPKDANDLIEEIDHYLKPGEENQDKRIERIRELSTKVFGTDRLPQFTHLVAENRQMLDSFAVVASELRTLAQNLKNAEDLQEKLKLEKQLADEKLTAAKVEIAAAEAARAEAENARMMAEKLAAETLERAAQEAKRLKEEKIEAERALKKAHTESQSSFSQTDDIQPRGETIIQETITTATTTKEIHILEKTEIEKTIPFVERKEPSPVREMKNEESQVEIVQEPRLEVVTVEPVQAQIIEELIIPPEFTVPLKDATTREGEKCTFECHLIGQPKPEVVWYKNGVSILNNPDYSTMYIDDICSLTIERTFLNDSATFTCKAFNIAGSADTTATLRIRESTPEEQTIPPTFVKDLQPSVAVQGTSHCLECKVQGNPLPTVQWFKNDVNIDNSPDYVITYNNGEAVLKFEEVLLEDKGVYMCKAMNCAGHACSSASLNVECPEEESRIKPDFTLLLSNAMVRAGQKIKLECEAHGNPTPTFTWYHNEEPIVETERIKIQTDGVRSNLIVSEASPEDAGCYSVMAKNDVGDTTVSCNVSVKPLLPPEPSVSEMTCDNVEPVIPKIQLPLKDVEVQESCTVRLDCVIVGLPEPEVIWYHDDQPVKESADFQLLFQGDNCSLIIHEALMDDAGVYKVVAINSGGETSSQCKLTVLPASSPPDQADKSEEKTKEAIPGIPPKFVKLPTDSLVAEGEDAVFECMVTGEPVPTVKWYSDSGEITPGERITIEQKEDGTGTLKIRPTIAEDKGNYVVKTTNVHGEAKAFARLVVKTLGQKQEEFVPMEEKLIPPTFKERFEDRRIPDGITTKFECIVTGKPSPKIQWLFNNQPVHGKDFLVSVSGDRQVLTIPETDVAHDGNISCVAENAAGKAICSARIEIDTGRNEDTRALVQVSVQDLVPSVPIIDDMHAASHSEKHYTSEKSLGEGGGEGQMTTKMSSIVTQSSSSQTSTKKEFTSSLVSSNVGDPTSEKPTSVCMKATMLSSTTSLSENGAPPVVQSQKVEEFEKILRDQLGEIRQDKTVVVSQGEDGIKRDVKTTQIQKPTRKSIAPRFVSPVTGMIVDQGTDVVLEGILDGYPQPTVSWCKNGQELTAKDGIITSYSHNHVRLELKCVNVKDAGRYTCTVTNDVGTASSTADLVVRKTIFPPVFGRRLQAQVVKRGDRVTMEVEITGTPEPTVTWYKDDVPIRENPPELRLKQQGNCYMLIIEKASKDHAGKYMVRATNAGGEAQSIADFAVFEPTPDTMVEVHKTVVYEDMKDQRVIQPEIKKDEILPPKVTFVQTSPATQPSSIISLPSATESTLRTIETKDESGMKSIRSEMISSIIESHQTETKSEQKFHMKLEHKTPPIIPDPKPLIRSVIKEEVMESEKPIAENENIDTVTIAKKDALSFFESITKEPEETPKGPKEMIKLVDDSEGQKHEVKVDQLLKSYERSTVVQEVKKPEIKPDSDFQSTKQAVQDIFTKLRQGPSPRGIENNLIEFPYEGYKTTTTTQMQSTESSFSEFNLVPEPPPEIGYMPKPEEMKKKRPEISLKAKQLQESFEKTLSPIEAPIGGVKIFPSPMPKPPEPVKTITTLPPLSIPPPFELNKKEIYEETCIKRDVQEKKETKFLKEEFKSDTPKFTPAPAFRSVSPPRPWSSSSDVETRSHISTDISEYRCQSAASSHQELLRPTSPKPSADGLAMEKSWAKKHTESSRKSWPPQSGDVAAQKPEWQVPPGEDYKTSSKEFRQEVEEIPGGVKKTCVESSSTIEKHSWSSQDRSMEKKSMQPAPPPLPQERPIIYNAETIKVDHTVNPIHEKSLYEKYVSECDVKKIEVSEKTFEEYSSKRLWTGGEDLIAPSLVKSIESATKPMSPVYPPYVDTLVLQPGPPPEMGYIPPPPMKQEQRTENIQRTSIQQVIKVPSTPVKSIPPPSFIPKKKAEIHMPFVPPPPPTPTKPPVVPNLEPFPFQPSPAQHKSSIKLPSPATPSKFVKGQFGPESDYESDYEGPFKSKWRPYESDGEEPRYRRVKPPSHHHPSRPRSTEPEPVPPSKFEVPPALSGPSKSPLLDSSRQTQEKISNQTTFKRYEKDSKQQQQHQQQQPRYQGAQTMPINLKPGSPPIYIQPTPVKLAPSVPSFSSPTPPKKPESPKFKIKTFQKESGYMADTEEPLHQKMSNSSVQKVFGKSEDGTTSMSSFMESHSSYSEKKSQFFESKTYESSQQQKLESSSFVPFVPPPATPSQKYVEQQRSSHIERGVSSLPGTGPTKFTSSKETICSTDQSLHRKFETTKKIQTSSPSPSKFVKSEFRESDYESDYESRIPTVWKPRNAEYDHPFKPVKPSLSGSGKPKEPTTPSSAFAATLSKRMEETQKKDGKPVTRPKSVLLPGTPPEIGYAPPQGSMYYESHSSGPFQNAIGTETKKTVRMDESTESSRRIVTVEQTSRVIKFGDSQKTNGDLGSFDSSATSQRQKQQYHVPMPKKFVQGQFRESDYESDVDSSRIKPKWTPTESDTEDPRYRRVQPPTAKHVRSVSAPVRQEHVVSPLEFDTGPPVNKKQTFFTQQRDDTRINQYDSQSWKQEQQSVYRKDDHSLQPGPPPKFGYVSRSDVKKAANHVASRHMSDMTSSFKSKTEKFVNEIQSDLKQGKPILKHPTEARNGEGDEPRTYREESRLAEHGTKHIDPDTGLIYFKYDFGYEFGIVLPGEGKKTMGNKSIQGQRRASDIDVPIVHEFTTRQENGYSKRPGGPSTNRMNKGVSKFGTMKTVKWEPTSESEFSEVEDLRNTKKRHSFGGTTNNRGMPAPPSIVIPCSPSPSRWDHTTPSPLSLSPSLPSLSPRYSSATGPPSNVDSAGSPWPTSNGVQSSKEVIQPYLEVLPKKAPVFITPLKDIAVVSGQTARFECIVQAEPQPNILWSKDGRIVENTLNYEVYYKNGVCRLTISRAFPNDAGTYACTATNSLGSTVTYGTLQIPGNRRSLYSCNY